MSICLLLMYLGKSLLRHPVLSLKRIISANLLEFVPFLFKYTATSFRFSAEFDGVHLLGLACEQMLDISMR